MKISGNFGITNPNFSGRMVKVGNSEYIDSDFITRMTSTGDHEIALQTNDGNGRYINITTNKTDLKSVADKISEAKTSSGTTLDITR